MAETTRGFRVETSTIFHTAKDSYLVTSITLHLRSSRVTELLKITFLTDLRKTLVDPFNVINRTITLPLPKITSK